MRITRCDRCGKLLGYKDELFIVEVNNRVTYRTCAPDLYDLCTDCKIALEVWMNAYNGGGEDDTAVSKLP